MGRFRRSPLPPPPNPETVKSFFRQLRETGVRLRLHTFEAATRWWLGHPNPLTYQQALGLPNDLYRHFLTHRLIDDGEAYRLAASGIVSEDSYRDIRLWYRNGNAASCWLGPIELNGKGNLYALTFHYATPAARELKFYLLDDYYRYMNHML